MGSGSDSKGGDGAGRGWGAPERPWSALGAARRALQRAVRRGAAAELPPAGDEAKPGEAEMREMADGKAGGGEGKAARWLAMARLAREAKREDAGKLAKGFAAIAAEPASEGCRARVACAAAERGMPELLRLASGAFGAPEGFGIGWEMRMEIVATLIGSRPGEPSEPQAAGDSEPASGSWQRLRAGEALGKLLGFDGAAAVASTGSGEGAGEGEQGEEGGEEGGEEEGLDSLDLLIEGLRGASEGQEERRRDAARCLGILVDGAGADRLNRPWPCLAGERRLGSHLLEAVFAADMAEPAMWALGPLAEAGLDLGGSACGRSAAQLLVGWAAAQPGRVDAGPLLEELGKAGAALRGAPGSGGALHMAIRERVGGRLDWGWAAALYSAGAPLAEDGEPAMRRWARAAGVDAPHKAEVVEFLAKRGCDFKAAALDGTNAAHRSAMDGERGLEWWAAMAEIDAGWLARDEFGRTPFDVALDAPGGARGLASFMDRRWPMDYAFAFLGIPAKAKQGWRPSSPLLAAFAAWAASLGEPWRKALAEAAGDEARKAEREANEAKDERPRYELYSERDWQEFSQEHLGGKDDSPAKKFAGRVKKQGEAHRIKPLALAAPMMEALGALREDFPHFEEVIGHIEDCCWLQANGDGSFHIPPMLLAGPPGVGKTFFFQRVADCVRTGYRVLHMESMTASWILTGSSSQWSDARPGALFSALDLGETANPIMLLDEIDKASSESKFPPALSLLPLLEPHTAKSFQDECVPLKWDSRRVCWVATANEIEKVPAPLRSRLDVFSVRAPNAHERRALCQGVYRAVIGAWQWGAKMDAKLPEETLDAAAAIQGEGATRDLRRGLTTACAKAVRDGRSLVLPRDLPPRSQAKRPLWDAAVGGGPKRAA